MDLKPTGLDGLMISIRAVQADDAKAIARLLGQLGYPCTPEEAEARLPGDSNQAVGVACASTGQVIGWIEVRRSRALEAGTYAEIIGLVVDDQVRGRGAGTALLSWAYEWARNRDAPRLRVRTNIVRADAAEFYRRSGFVEIKQQRMLEMPL